MKNFFETSIFTKLIVILGILAAALGIFWLGTVVGFRQAEYSSRWAGHYAEVFGGMRGPFSFGPGNIGGQGGDTIASSNGAVGTVMAVTLPTIAVKGSDEAEKVIVLGPKTLIRKFRSDATTTDIQVGDFLMAVGTPDEAGRIAATFVRIAPAMPTSMDRRMGR